jgi:hypothetical protein
MPARSRFESDTKVTGWAIEFRRVCPIRNPDQRSRTERRSNSRNKVIGLTVGSVDVNRLTTVSSVIIQAVQDNAAFRTLRFVGDMTM